MMKLCANCMWSKTQVKCRMGTEMKRKCLAMKEKDLARLETNTQTIERLQKENAELRLKIERLKKKVKKT